MLSLDFIRENKQKVVDAAKNKNKTVDIDRILQLDDERREQIKKIQTLREERNKLAKNFNEENKQRGIQIKDELKILEETLNKTEADLQKLLILVPNVPFDDVPVGKDESENVVIRKWGELPKFDFQPKDHMELGVALDVIDTETAAKVTGARFAYIKNELAVLQYAIVMWVFKILSDEVKLQQIAETVKPGYTAKPFVPIIPPVLIKPEIYTRMGRLDETQAEERYYLPKDDIYLIGSAEHTLGPIHMEEIIPENRFPLRYVGYSTAFRREAGSYGKDVKGILRLHQFDKIEIESFTLPEDSRTEQDFIVAIQEHLLQSLKIPYQVISICTGDMGGPDARQIDLESWIPAQEKYRETHTSDLMTDYQARRLGTKVRRKDGSTELVHMNDATVFAIGRILIAILENYQQADGSILVPEVLQQFTGFEKIVAKK